MSSENKKKKSELNSLFLTKEFINSRTNLTVRKYIHSLCPIDDERLSIIQSERPDFIINDDFSECSYIIEHFLIDYCYDGPKSNQSESKRANKAISDIYHRYHDPLIGTINDKDIDSATADIEAEINSIANIASSFDYDKYIEGFKRVFNQHYGNMEAYKTNILISGSIIKTGFIIELHCDTTLMHASWNGSVVSFEGKHRAFPLTKDIISIIQTAPELDFVILSQFNEGVYTEACDVRLFEPRNIGHSIDIQRIRIYDKIYYPKINKHIKLNIEKNE